METVRHWGRLALLRGSLNSSVLSLLCVVFEVECYMQSLVGHVVRSRTTGVLRAMQAVGAQLKRVQEETRSPLAPGLSDHLCNTLAKNPLPSACALRACPRLSLNVMN